MTRINRIPGRYALLCFCAGLILLTAALLSFIKPRAADDDNPQWYLFCYFTNEAAGMHYALSKNGLTWKELNNGKAWLIPQVGGKLMRDPSINAGIDGVFRVVWTTGWTGTDIGYSSSTDLVHWTKEEALPVMKNVDGTKMCWAPEIFYDDQQKKYMVIWSSAVKDTWSVYYATTTDFKQFSQPEILLNNGFYGGGKAGQKGPIDAFILKDSSAKYILFYKEDDNTGVANLFYRFASSPRGPWTNDTDTGPVLPSTGDEGPSCIKVNGEYRMYTDPFESDKAYVFISTDLKTWQRKITNVLMSHGTVLEIPAAVAEKLMAY